MCGTSTLALAGGRHNVRMFGPEFRSPWANGRLIGGIFAGQRVFGVAETENV